MAKIDAAYRDLWRAIKSSLPLYPDAAIYKEWQVRYTEWGSPIGPEMPLDTGGVYQVFAHAIVTWTEANGVQVV